MVINNQTISFFDSISHTSVDNSINLDHIKIEDAEENTCLKVIDKETSLEYYLCVMQYASGDHDEMMREFKEKFIFMKEKCHESLLPQDLPSAKVMKNIMGL